MRQPCLPNGGTTLDGILIHKLAQSHWPHGSSVQVSRDHVTCRISINNWRVEFANAWRGRFLLCRRNLPVFVIPPFVTLRKARWQIFWSVRITWVWTGCFFRALSCGERIQMLALRSTVVTKLNWRCFVDPQACGIDANESWPQL